MHLTLGDEVTDASAGTGKFVLYPEDGPGGLGYASSLDAEAIEQLASAVCANTGMQTGNFRLYFTFNRDKGQLRWQGQTGKTLAFAARAIRYSKAAHRATKDPSFDFQKHAMYSDNITSDREAMSVLKGCSEDETEQSRELTQSEIDTYNEYMRDITTRMREMQEEESLTNEGEHEGLRDALNRRNAILATCRHFEFQRYPPSREEATAEEKFSATRKSTAKHDSSTKLPVKDMPDIPGTSNRLHVGSYPSSRSLLHSPCRAFVSQRRTATHLSCMVSRTTGSGRPCFTGTALVEPGMIRANGVPTESVRRH